MFISFPFVGLMDSFWSRVKPEQGNWAGSHLLYQEKQAPTSGATPAASWNPEGDADYFPYRNTQAEPCGFAKEQMSFIQIILRRVVVKGTRVIIIIQT